MRFAALLFAAALCAPGAARAAEGPWCAVQSIGQGSVTENCSLPSFDQCRTEVIAGNRGFCKPNPRWAAARSPVPRHRRYRRAHSR